MKKTLVVILILVLAVGLGYVGYNRYIKKDDASSTNSSTSSQQTKNSGNGFNKSQYSLTDPTSIWVIVNKQNGIPTTYEPDVVVPDVRLRLGSSEQQMHISSVAAPAIKEMFDAAKADGVNLVFGSGYRSATLQKQFYDSYVAQDGQVKADTYSARPGHSEHQTGLALDITSSNGTCHLEICWEGTPEGKWVAANAYKYGFILRYPNGKEGITGYQYEPWHFRYVGKELAAQIQSSGQTLEEFFGYPPAPNYD